MRRPRVRLRLARKRPLPRPRLPKVPRTLLPGMLTIGNLLGGYSAILAASQGRFGLAALLIGAAALFDLLDGRVARMTGGESEIGIQLDSLCDAVSFGVAPSLLAFHMGIHSLGRAGYAVCFLFAACGVIRLARFNVLPADHHFFTGLPIPLAAAAITAPVLRTDGEALPAAWVPYYAGFVAIIAFLMVSRIRYRTFKDVPFRGKVHLLLPLFVGLLAGLIWKYEYVIPGVIVLYLLSPLLLKAWARGVPSARPRHP